jgi:ABC-type multidrug transport system fused ATPase/permease subunit
MLILGSIVAQAVAVGVAGYFSTRLAEKVLAELREDFIGDVLEFPLAAIDKAGVGDLVSRTTRDVGVIADAVRRALPSAVSALMTIVITIGGLILVGPLLALPCLIAVPILWGAARWYLAKARNGYLNQAASYSEIAEVLTETVEGSRTVEALQLGPWRDEKMGRSIRRTFDAERYTLNLRTVFLPICDTAYAVPVVATLIVGGLLYGNGLVSLTSLTTAILYTQQLAGPIDVLLYQTDVLQVASVSLARLFGIRSGIASHSASLTEARSRLLEHRDIAVTDVSYSYSTPASDVLRHVSFTIKQGERLAIVGPSGAGKTTLARLLAGMEKPRIGSITVGDAVLTDLSPSQRRHEIALVTQEHHIFRGSIRDNLTIGRTSASDDELDMALRAVGARSWVSQMGLETQVGSGGRELTEEQAQQLSLARLMLADPKALVLDEATSLLDLRSARLLERSLARILHGRTVISIAHRLHTAHDADRVLVMEAGRIVESGPHAALLDADGAYAALWKSWHGDYVPIRATR